MNDMPSGRRMTFWALTALIPVIFVVFTVEAYFLYGYVTYPVDYCGSFAKLDERIGWVLKPETRSCIEGRESAFGDMAFRAEVSIGRNGERIIESPDGRGNGNAAPVEILAIGDSWTFGYGIEGSETFAARLSSDHGRSSAVFASPAYSGAQALLLGERAAKLVEPDVIVYLEMGFWERAVCTGNDRPERILKPCYWTGSDGKARLVLPHSGKVHDASRYGILPGGIVGAGEKTLSYFLISRPLAKLRQLFVRAGLASGFGNDFFAAASPSEIGSIKRAHYANLVGLARDHGARLLLLDPGGIYDPARKGMGENSTVLYVGKERWGEKVRKRMSGLSAEEARVPHDGHYGPGAHRIIADLIDAELASIR